MANSPPRRLARTAPSSLDETDVRESVLESVLDDDDCLVERCGSSLLGGVAGAIAWFFLFRFHHFLGGAAGVVGGARVAAATILAARSASASARFWLCISSRLCQRSSIAFTESANAFNAVAVSFRPYSPFCGRPVAGSRTVRVVTVILVVSRFLGVSRHRVAISPRLMGEFRRQTNTWLSCSFQFLGVCDFRGCRGYHGWLF